MAQYNHNKFGNYKNVALSIMTFNAECRLS